MNKHQIDIQVRTTFIPQQSDPDEDKYAFAYTITITNKGSAPAKLMGRHWIIRDANEKVMEVHGSGVVGEQPHLAPGQSFEYTSGTLLETPYGTMRGSYQMVADDGTGFDAEIPEFVLSVPRTLH